MWTRKLFRQFRFDTSDFSTSHAQHVVCQRVGNQDTGIGTEENTHEHSEHEALDHLATEQEDHQQGNQSGTSRIDVTSELIQIADQIRHQDVGIYIVGDEPTEEFKKIKEVNKLDKIHYIGFKDKIELAEYYAAADIFILLTRGDVWGLVINEAMMFGLPIISSDKCIAGLEMINDAENGFIVSLNNNAEIIEKINELLFNQDIYDRIAKNNIRKAAEYTFERMVEIHINLLGEMVKS